MIERRRTVVTLYHGDDQAKLAELRDEVARAADREAIIPRRHSQKSEAARLAVEHDKLQDESEERAVKVMLWALTNDQFEQLSELHPPRDKNDGDAKFGLNMRTFPAALLRAALLSPDESPADVAKAVEKGAARLAALGDLTRLQVRKLESGAWSVNVEDDSLPKFSLVSLLRRERAGESAPQPDSE